MKFNYRIRVIGSEDGYRVAVYDKAGRPVLYSPHQKRRDTAVNMAEKFADGIDSDKVLLEE